MDKEYYQKLSELKDSSFTKEESKKKKKRKDERKGKCLNKIKSKCLTLLIIKVVQNKR